MNKDTLKKHHFWILSGSIPLLVLIAILLLTSQVGGEIDKKKGEIKKATDDLKAKQNPPPKSLLEGLDKQRAELEKKQTDLWKENWERQIGIQNGKQDPSKNLLKWPKSNKLNRFNYTADYATDPNQMKFGAEIPNPDGEYREFPKREVYLAQFSNANNGGIPATGMADTVAPTAFNNGWQFVLRHIAGETGWGNAEPRPEQLWLALEDIWVQRALLGQIRLVNDQIGTFQQVPLVDVNGKTITDPLNRSFESRTWKVDLKLAPQTKDSNRFVLTGSLKNITDRLQLLGNGNVMTLKIWFSTNAEAQPFDFKIGGEFVPGQKQVPIEQTAEHVLPIGIIPTEIARVEQVFDTRTVPIRRIDHLVIGCQIAKDCHYGGYALLPPDFKAYADPPAGTAPAAPAAGPGGVSTLGGPGLGGGGGLGGAAAVGVVEGGGSVDAVTDLNKKRYIQVTGQVRRMPVALTVIVDQAYVQDVLLAYANSPLRFQVTQMYWERFREGLNTGGTGGGSSGDDTNQQATATVGGGGSFGSAGSRGFELRLSAPGFGMPGGSLPGYSAPGSGGPAGSGGSGGAMTVTESQLTAGLVKLTVHGIISLYEKFQDTSTPAPAK